MTTNAIVHLKIVYNCFRFAQKNEYHWLSEYICCRAHRNCDDNGNDDDDGDDDNGNGDDDDDDKTQH